MEPPSPPAVAAGRPNPSRRRLRPSGGIADKINNKPDTTSTMTSLFPGARNSGSSSTTLVDGRRERATGRGRRHDDLVKGQGVLLPFVLLLLLVLVLSLVLPAPTRLGGLGVVGVRGQPTPRYVRWKEMGCMHACVSSTDRSVHGDHSNVIEALAFPDRPTRKDDELGAPPKDDPFWSQVCGMLDPSFGTTTDRVFRYSKLHHIINRFKHGARFTTSMGAPVSKFNVDVCIRAN